MATINTVDVADVERLARAAVDWMVANTDRNDLTLYRGLPGILLAAHGTLGIVLALASIGAGGRPPRSHRARRCCARHRDSAATVRLLRLGSDDEALEVTRRLSAMVDHAAEWIAFPAQGAGRYRLELAEPVGTPTWKWHQGDEVAPVGGTAEIDGLPLGRTNFLFSATVTVSG